MKLQILSAFVAVGLSATPLMAQESYKGSSFNEVMNVLEDRDPVLATPVEQQEFAVYKSGRLPQYQMNRQSVFAFGSAQLQADAKRTVSERADYYPRLNKLLHPNGVCLTGEWVIDQNSPYSGYFKKGTTGLFVGRVSVAMQETVAKAKRGFGVAGKIFPTTNPNQVVPTVNFFTVDVLLGEVTRHFMDTKVTNEPPTGITLSIPMIKFGMDIADALTLADHSPMFRPIRPIAKLAETGSVRSPKWIRISAAPAQKMNDEADFRNEVMTAIAANNGLLLDIEVSETTKDRNATTGWTRIGHIDAKRGIVNYGCDRRLHFAHPKADD